MSSNASSPPAGHGLSLYQNLLGGSSDSNKETPGTISRAPVMFNQHGHGLDQDEVKNKTSSGRHHPNP
jgi:hypothetical protein